jgi:hypothetical protein
VSIKFTILGIIINFSQFFEETKENVATFILTCSADTLEALWPKERGFFVRHPSWSKGKQEQCQIF